MSYGNSVLLINNNHTKGFFFRITVTLKEPKMNCNTSLISFSFCSVTGDQLVIHLDRLRELVLRDCPNLKDGGLTKIISQCPNLTSLDISHSWISRYALLQIRKKFPQMRDLFYSQWSEDSDQDFL